MGAFESGQGFLAGVLAKLPTEQQAQAKAIFESAEAKDAVIVLGDGTLARSDYSKQMDALKTKETELQGKFEELNGWYTTNAAALKEYTTIKPEYDKLKGTRDPDDPPPPPDPVDARKVAQEVVNDAGRDYVAVSAWLAGKAVEHAQRFSEPLDTMALVNNPKLGKPIPGQPGRVFSLNDVYTEAHGERVAAKQKEADEAKFTAEVEKRLTEERKKLHLQPPFPLRGESPSVLDVLSTKDGPAAHTLDSATAEYERLQAARGQ